MMRTLLAAICSVVIFGVAATATAGEADLGHLVVRGKDRESTVIMAIVKHPHALSLRIQSQPKQNVYVEQAVRCRKGSRGRTIRDNFVRGSGFVRRLDLTFRNPDSCRVFAFVRYPRAKGHGVVTVSLYRR